jgi:hypothetical protein
MAYGKPHLPSLFGECLQAVQGLEVVAAGAASEPLQASSVWNI